MTKKKGDSNSAQSRSLTALLEIGGVPDLSSAKCIEHPDEFDLDVLKHDRELVEFSKQVCRNCPVYYECRDWTNQLNSFPATQVRGVVQAGEAYGLHGSPGRKTQPQEEVQA